MSVRDVMMIENAMIAAGAGDFSRTAFEYSPEIKPPAQDSGISYPALILAKFVAPEDGIYRYVFSHKGNTKDLVYIKRESFWAPTVLSLYYDSRLNSVRTRYEDLQQYFTYNVGGAKDYTYYTSDNLTNTINYSFVRPGLEGKVASYTEKTLYFSASKGEAIILWAVASVSDANDLPSLHSFRNQKITY